MGQKTGHYGAAMLLRDELRGLGFFAESVSGPGGSSVFVARHDIGGADQASLSSARGKIAMVVIHPVDGEQKPFASFPGLNISVYEGDDASDADIRRVAIGASLQRFRLDGESNQWPSNALG